MTTKKKLLRCKPNSLSQAKQQRPAASRASRSWRPRFAEAHRQARCCAEPGGIMFPGIGGRILVGSLSPAPRAGPLAQPCTASWDSFPSALQASLASGRRPCRASSWVLLHRLKSYAGSEADTKHSSAKDSTLRAVLCPSSPSSASWHQVSGGNSPGRRDPGIGPPLFAMGAPLPRIRTLSCKHVPAGSSAARQLGSC